MIQKEQLKGEWLKREWLKEDWLKEEKVKGMAEVGSGKGRTHVGGKVEGGLDE